MYIRDVIYTISKDYFAKYQRSLSFSKFIKSYFFDLNFRVVVNYRIQCFCGQKNKFFRILALYIKNKNVKKYGIEIGIKSKIKEGFCIHHLNGIVIGEGAEIGRNFHVYQQVTIGQKGDKYPIIGDQVRIYPGAKVIGGITIGDSVSIGANSVVLKNVPSKDIVAGIPAKSILKKEG
ncbi:serine O-acetyltransferase [Bacillus sp. B3-WWTP-C-10-D-3]|uniref:serine O-acetyltransferase n=1 Tax=Bacillus sp. B3-WWTP-C-10-D-3 TaxID=2653217 RepID=UPI001D01EC28|nr:serine acetyltransferase [Bacillus sp. B3-WWTP-C-10-D-3]